MRSAFAVLLLAGTLLLAAPADAQFRADLPTREAPAAVTNTGAPSLGLARLFASDKFKLSHSYEMSYSSFGGQGLGLGVYTGSLRWQPTDKLAGRADIAVATSPFGDAATQEAFGFGQDTPARVYLRNAELAYKPTENSLIRFQVQQSPYGAYASPYGRMGGFGGYGAFGSSPYGGTTFGASWSSDGDDLFFRSN
jgi:hypothetical protein